MRASLALCLLLAACAGGAGRTPAADSTAADTVALVPSPGDSLLRLERSPCFGFCPVYTLTLLADGRGVVKGNAPTATFGREFQVPAARVDSLARAMLAGGFLALDTAYLPGYPGCDHAATDFPSSILTLWQGGTRHEVRYYHGCYPQEADAPPPIRHYLAWALAIDSLGRTFEWVDSLRGR